MLPEPLLTLREAAKVYKVTLNSLQEACARGDLKTVRLGRLYTRVSWVEEMICRAEQPRPASTWTPRAAPGLSATDQHSAASERLKDSVRMLRSSSRATSQKSTPHPRATTR